MDPSGVLHCCHALPALKPQQPGPPPSSSHPPQSSPTPGPSESEPSLSCGAALAHLGEGVLHAAGEADFDAGGVVAGAVLVGVAGGGVGALDAFGDGVGALDAFVDGGGAPDADAEAAALDVVGGGGDALDAFGDGAGEGSVSLVTLERDAGRFVAGLFRAGSSTSSPRSSPSSAPSFSSSLSLPDSCSSFPPSSSLSTSSPPLLSTSVSVFLADLPFLATAAAGLFFAPVAVVLNSSMSLV